MGQQMSITLGYDLQCEKVRSAVYNPEKLSIILRWMNGNSIWHNITGLN